MTARLITADLDAIPLWPGSHPRRRDGMCAMEAAAYIAGGRHTAYPKCVSPVITEFMISWNDKLSSNEERGRLLKPLLPLVIGTTRTAEDELRRAWLAVDWIVREHLPAWLDAAGIAIAAEALRALPEIVGGTALAPALKPLKDVAKRTNIARAAVKWGPTIDDMTSVALIAAQVGTAGRAAWRACAGPVLLTLADWDHLAGFSVRDITDLAAVVAVWRRREQEGWLTPVVASLQESAQDLVRRMCAVGREAQ